MKAELRLTEEQRHLVLACIYKAMAGRQLTRQEREHLHELARLFEGTDKVVRITG
jgi:hypothetical protein